MRIRLVCLGTLKEPYLSDAQDRLLGIVARKNGISGCEVVELKEEPVRDGASPALIEQALAIEAERILEKIPDRARLVCLDLDGQPATEQFFSGLRRKLLQQQTEDLIFLIGGSNGIHDRVKAKAHHRIAFSRLTYPHQLFRIALLEAMALYL